eukprot:TRINITY_DN33642_c0_g1_i1.p1 TRINITY_DN33642_c0_g1~~TRINITY_DN33642_c0_g1_i1.p1  ORF type:complete len:194 (-),score=37.32 TRINITY_DN33642_c0_g1_i1:128-709(-)
MDASLPDTVEDLIRRVESEIGPIQVVLYNLGAQIGNRPLEELTPKAFELGWKLGCQGLFRVAKAVTPMMIARGGGVLLVTSATAAVRGNAGQHSHAAAMGGRRMLCQTLNAELGPLGVHVCHLLVDGMVNAPDTLGRMIGKEAFAELNSQKDLMIQPKEIAELYWLVAHQPRSTWTFEMDVRSHADTAWWNHA